MINIEQIYAARHKDISIVEQSSSGGVFYAISQFVLALGGVIYGVLIDEKTNICYKRAESVDDIIPMLGSKYVFAHFTTDNYEQIKTDLLNNRTVLFAGTPCQNNAIYLYLKENRISDKNIYFVDFYRCHGGISPELWRAAVKKDRIVECKFRDKKNGWQNYNIYQLFTDGKESRELFSISVLGGFFKLPHARHVACDNCRYIYDENRKADISFGDFWDTYNIPRKWDDDKGVSIIQIHTEKGIILFNQTGNYCDFEPVNTYLKRLPDKQDIMENVLRERDKFWKTYNEYGYEKLTEAYCKLGIWNKVLLTFIRPFLVKTRLLRLIHKMNNINCEREHEYN